MNELSLVNYLRANAEMAKVVFPREAEAAVDPNELKEKIVLENPEHPQAENLKGFLFQFISDISNEADGGERMTTTISEFTFYSQSFFSYCKE